ncbi:MAG: DUF4423 domain-containing protein [Pseudobdellovibrionaceae bacterium]
MADMDGRLLLRQQFQERKNRNPAYSLRAFARDLDVSVTSLSQYFSRLRDLSKTSKLSVISRLQFSPLEKEIFLEQGPVDKIEQNQAIVSEDLFNLIGDWVSFALLSLSKIKNQTADAKVIAKKLGVTPEEITSSLDRLQRFKLILIKNGKLKRTQQSLSTSDDVPSEAIRKYHLSILQKAQSALQREPIDRRDFSAMTFPASLKNVQQIKKILRTTQNRIAKLAQTGDSDDVFVISMQYFPLTLQTHPLRKGESK